MGRTRHAPPTGNGKIAVGDTAPDFTLPAQTGGTVRLHDLRGQKAIVLYFYPKDHTSGCTAEACAFRDSYEVFTEAGAEVVGVSSDSVGSTRALRPGITCRSFCSAIAAGRCARCMAWSARWASCPAV